jgi:hypothetical protein
MDTTLRRWDLINTYIKHYSFKTFLEIGHDRGQEFDQIDIEHKESVDVSSKTNPTYVMSSDDFFEKYDTKYDIIFIDGLHEHAQVDRDIHNSLTHLNKGGVIIMHDCHPVSEACQRHLFAAPGGHWTGDCWKAFVKNRSLLPYELYVWDYDWGCGVIDTNISKSSNTESLPTIMTNMKYSDLIDHPYWMNYKLNIAL